MEIKYYYISCGIMGLINGKYKFFATEGDYLDTLAEILADSREN